jgi:hypothetical protein
LRRHRFNPDVEWADARLGGETGAERRDVGPARPSDIEQHDEHIRFGRFVEKQQNRNRSDSVTSRNGGGMGAEAPFLPAQAENGILMGNEYLRSIRAIGFPSVSLFQ